MTELASRDNIHVHQIDFISLNIVDGFDSYPAVHIIRELTVACHRLE